MNQPADNVLPLPSAAAPRPARRRCTKLGLALRLDETEELLRDGLAHGTVVKLISSRHGCGRSQARKYVGAVYRRQRDALVARPSTNGFEYITGAEVLLDVTPAPMTMNGPAGRFDERWAAAARAVLSTGNEHVIGVTVRHNRLQVITLIDRFVTCAEVGCLRTRLTEIATAAYRDPLRDVDNLQARQR